MSYRSLPGFTMTRVLAGVAAYMLLIALGAAPQDQQAFHGEITESWCSGPEGHKLRMQRGETAEHCAMLCLKMGAKYVLSSPENMAVYKLDNQKLSKPFFGQNVFVTGILDNATGTIHVLGVSQAVPAQAAMPAPTQAAAHSPSMQAPRQAPLKPAALSKSIYIFCDTCPKKMDSATRVASQELVSWRRFNVVSDPKGADLILIISANPYLGDYGTRSGPDTRPFRIDITYVTVIDPHTGRTLWGDSRQSGWLLVGRATRDLIDEFRKEFEAGRVRLTG